MRYWKRLNPDKSVNTVESYSHHQKIKGAVEIDKQEFNRIIAEKQSHSTPPPQRDLLAEIDSLVSRVKALEEA